jgi:glycosyltransferase involved in cell wall biosynthesis
LVDSATPSTDPPHAAPFRVGLLTRGPAEQISGGHLYQWRVIEGAAEHDVLIERVTVSRLRNPVRSDVEVTVVDSLVAATVAPWVVLHRPASTLVALIHQPPGGVDGRTRRTAVAARLDLLLYRRCDLLIAVSEFLADELSGTFRLPARRITVVEPGTEKDLLVPGQRDLRQGRAVAVLCVANWLPNKGLLELLEAVGALPVELATLHLVGRDDADRRYSADVRERLDLPDLRDRVVCHGPQPPAAVAELLAGADVFALASAGETFGMVYAEALSAGVPIVGWRTGNLPHLVEHDREGLLVEPGDVCGLSASLRRVAADAALRTRLASAARRRGDLLPTWPQSRARFFTALRVARSRHG